MPGRHLRGFGDAAGGPPTGLTWGLVAQAEVKAKELRQQQDKQQSLNAVQSERRRQQEEKAQMQANLQAANIRASAAEGQRTALEQRSGQLQQELAGMRAQLAASEQALAECRAHRPDAAPEQVRLCNGESRTSSRQHMQA